MADAQKKAEDILDQLQKMQAKSNEHMDDLQALTLAQRLRKVSAEEKEIGGQLARDRSDGHDWIAAAGFAVNTSGWSLIW